MARWSAGLLLVGLLALAGCTRTEDYLEVVKEQQQALREVTDILSKIHNAKDMAAARDELDDRFTRFDRIARKARELPKPPPPEVERQIDPQAVKRAFYDMAFQVSRVKSLEGGEAFFRQFEGHSTLLSHVD